jgi:hypothetical protein
MPTRTPQQTQLSASYPLASSNIETIDYALYNFVNDNLNIYCETNKGSQKVPVLFQTPERAFQIKNEPTLRKDNGRTISLPLITVKRTAMNKNPANKGRYGVYIPPYFDFYNKGGSLEIARKVQQDKTKNFANSNAIKKSSGGDNVNRQTFPGENKNVVYESISIPYPTFIEVTYEVKLFSEYQQQMNEMMETMSTFTGSPSRFKIEHGGNSYEALLDPSYAVANNFDLGTEERRFETTLTTTVLGYLIGAGKNQKTPNVVIRQSAAKIQIQRERTIVGDVPEFRIDNKDKYRP